MSLTMVVSFLSAGLLMLAPVAFSSELFRPDPRSPAETRAKRMIAISAVVIGVGTLLFMVPVIATREPGSRLPAQTTVVLLAAAGALIALGYLIRYLGARNTRKSAL
jgi:VIT1/CCC1 family predicted Fe2+/Mn2+ transporter